MSGYVPAPGKTNCRVAAVALVGAASLFTLGACATTTTGTAATTQSAAPAMTTTAAGTAMATPGAATPGAADADATTSLMNAEGAQVGTATFTESEGAVEIRAEIQGMDPGFYGFHIHGIGVCEPDSAAPNDPANTGDFMSAGPHLNPDQTDHPDHAGDLPVLLVMENGEARLAFTTDRLTIADLTEDDGAALMIHSNADNFANIPERYAPGGPDQDTLNTGDAGSRLACGVIETGTSAATPQMR